MTKQRREQFEFDTLLMKAFNGDIQTEEAQRLNHFIANNPEARRQYYRLLNITLALQEIGNIDSVDKNQVRLLENERQNYFQQVVEADLTESAIRKALGQEEGDGEQISDYQKEVLRRRQLTLADGRRFALKAAAVVILCLSILWLDRWIMRESAIQPRQVVAHLADQMNVKWDDAYRVPRDSGSMVQDRYRIMEGIVKIQFDHGAEVLIEGPAIYELVTARELTMSQGRCYVKVQPEGKGFTVNTLNSQIIDLGTEFGVLVDDTNKTQLHVFKGKTMLIAGLYRGKKTTCDVLAGRAREIDGDNASVHEIQLADNSFVQGMNSKSKLVWHGQKTINLADIVGGGNGLGTGQAGACINTLTGIRLLQNPIADQWVNPYKDELDLISIHGDNAFHNVAGNGFIDGVFIPDGNQAPVQISTQGHQFIEAPLTSGTGWGGVINVEKIIGRPIKMNNVIYGVPAHPALFMHANAGITFDLGAIRQAYSNFNIARFQSLCGIAEDYPNPEEVAGCADFWVLVDGQIRYVKKQARISQVGNIDISLAPDDRFLSLVTTDGGEGTPMGKNGRHSFNDWCIFAQPYLVLE